MPKTVDDTPENMEICKKNCGPCPTFQANGPLKNFEPHALFCARGASKKESVLEKGCNCFGCPLFDKYDLKGGWFCIYGVEGKK
jgi:hypothetical protein